MAGYLTFHPVPKCVNSVNYQTNAQPRKDVDAASWTQEVFGMLFKCSELTRVFHEVGQDGTRKLVVEVPVIDEDSGIGRS